jgi:hypothetical protein
MRGFLNWVTEKLRPLYGSCLPEELRLPEMPMAVFHRGAMERYASLAVSAQVPFGIFRVIGLKHAAKAAGAWRPRHRFLMEELSLAYYLVEQQRQRCILVEPQHVDRFVELLFQYFRYVGEPVPKTEVYATVMRYLEENSAPDAMLAEDANRPIRVDHPLLDELRALNHEIYQTMTTEYGPASLGDVGLRLDSELDASRYDSWTPINCRTFASTGGGGTHFSLLVQGGAITSDSPVVMTIPSAGDGSQIVGENLFDFLCLGCRRGYYSMEMLSASYPDQLVNVYANPHWMPKEGTGPGDLNGYYPKILGFLQRRLGLSPWPAPDRFFELQEKYLGKLVLPPDARD